MSTEMVSLYAVLADEKKQVKLWKSILSIIGINWRKCPSFRTIVRVNVCCLNSMLFFIGTWVVFYILVISLFCSAVMGSASLMGIK